jgi:hypothetical protein
MASEALLLKRARGVSETIRRADSRKWARRLSFELNGILAMPALRRRADDMHLSDASRLNLTAVQRARQAPAFGRSARVSVSP